jgi:hypothetical protein
MTSSFDYCAMQMSEVFGCLFADQVLIVEFLEEEHLEAFRVYLAKYKRKIDDGHKKYGEAPQTLSIVKVKSKEDTDRITAIISLVKKRNIRINVSELVEEIEGVEKKDEESEFTEWELELMRKQEEGS